ncbi:hypothetical protein [Olivibacter ginsenosidimutans]
MWLGLLLLGLCGTSFGQKLDKAFRSFYTGFQRNVAAQRLDALQQVIYFPLQTMYWIDGMNSFSDEEKANGLIQADEFDQYADTIFNDQVRRLIPETDVSRIQQIDVEASGDYYKRLGRLIDKGTTLLELYCEYGGNSSVGDHYFGFVFGRVQGEYRVMAYYTSLRIKK